MNTTSLLLGLGFLFLSGTVVVLYRLWFGQLAGRNESGIRRATVSLKGSLEQEEAHISETLAKKIAKNNTRKKTPLTFDERMFMAGIISPLEKKNFKRIQILCPVIVSVVMTIMLINLNDPMLTVVGIFLSVAGGLRLPSFIIDRRISVRDEEIMFYLPLVIEQIAIGVSSSLDTGPCVQLVVQMSDERDSHNVVTELLKLVLHYTKQGISLEDALTEVGKRTGHTELKHAFGSLAQVSRHGGEVTRQLQELANSVSAQRENKVEEKIKSLELKATPAVALVFGSFLILLLYALGQQITQGFASV